MNRILDIAKRLRRGPVAVLLGALLLAAVLIGTRPERAQIELPERAWSVNVQPVEVGDIRPTLELYGKIESPQDATLSAAVEADVLQVLVRDGDSVEAGAPLLVLDDRDAQLELLQRNADVQEIKAQISLEQRRLARNREALVKEEELLELTENNAERARSLYSDKLVSQANVDESSETLKRQQLSVTSRVLSIEESEIRISQLNAQLLRAEALRDKEQLNVDRTRVVAPFAGAISEVEVSVGDRIRVGETILRLHDPESLELRTQIPTRFVPRVRDALRNDSEMRAEVDSGRTVYPAKLVRVSGQTRQGSGSVDAFLRFDSAPQSTQLGATVRVLLSLPAEPNAISVPAESIYGRNRIYTVEGDRMMARDVERVGERLLADGSSEVIIRSPELNSDDRIITTKVSTAAEGVLVKVREPEGAAGNDQSMLAARDQE